MKTFLILISCFWVSISTQAQTATIQDENVLWIPAEPETIRFAISKTDMQKVEFVKSELGEIGSYNISFKMGDLLYVKDMENNSFPAKTKELFIQSGAGTILYLRLKINARNSSAVLEMKYEFILGLE